MLQAAGMQADYVVVDDRRGVVDPHMPSIYGNHMIAAIEIPPNVHDPRLQAVVTADNGRRYLIFDPTDERTPVGNLGSDLQGSYGLLIAGASSQILALPVLPPDDNGAIRTGTFTLAPDGTLTGAVHTARFGPDGAGFRTILNYTDQKQRSDQMQTMVAQDLPGATLDSFQFILPPDLSKAMDLNYKVTAPEYAHRAGSLLLVRPRVVGEDAVRFDDGPRAVPIDLDATGRWRDSFDITLPPGYTVDEIPDPVDLDVHFASYRTSSSVKGNVLHYEREYSVRQVQIPASDAADFRKFEHAILEDEKDMAVLKKQ